MKKKECAKNLTFDTPSWGAVGGLETKKGKHLRASLAHAKVRLFLSVCKCLINCYDIFPAPCHSLK